MGAPFPQEQPFELAREVEVLTAEPREPQSPHWAWRTVGGHRDIKTGAVTGMVPSPDYWLAPTPSGYVLSEQRLSIGQVTAIYYEAAAADIKKALALA